MVVSGEPWFLRLFKTNQSEYKVVMFFYVSTDQHKASLSMSDKLTDLVETLHKSVCDSAPVSFYAMYYLQVFVLRIKD